MAHHPDDEHKVASHLDQKGDHHKHLASESALDRFIHSIPGGAGWAVGTMATKTLLAALRRRFGIR